MSSVDRGTGAGRPRKKFREIEERWCKRQKRERDQEDFEGESDRIARAHRWRCLGFRTWQNRRRSCPSSRFKKLNAELTRRGHSARPEKASDYFYFKGGEAMDWLAPGQV